MKVTQKQWLRIYQNLIENYNNNFDKFKISTENNGKIFVLEFHEPQYETLFTLRYL